MNIPEQCSRSRAGRVAGQDRSRRNKKRQTVTRRPGPRQPGDQHALTDHQPAQPVSWIPDKWRSESGSNSVSQSVWSSISVRRKEDEIVIQLVNQSVRAHQFERSGVWSGRIS